jgi:hypothetical protein
MERKLWSALHRFANRSSVRGNGWLFTTNNIVMAYFWDAVHDRLMCWATDKRNWPEDLRPWRLPSQSQLSRRMRGSDVVMLMTEIENTFVALVGAEQRLIRIWDGKSLEVSNVNKDRWNAPRLADQRSFVADISTARATNWAAANRNS